MELVRASKEGMSGPMVVVADMSTTDSHFQVNVLSQVHLAFSLLPILQKTANSRLVLQSSDLHRASPSSVKFESLEEMNQDIGPSYLYNRTKLGMILFVRALVRRMHERKLGFVSDEQVWINAVHPGAVRTDQQEQAVEAYGWVGKALVAVTTPLMKDAIEEGCRPALFAGTSSDIITDKIQGQYVRLVSQSSQLDGPTPPLFPPATHV